MTESNASCLWQSNRPGTDYGYEITELGYTLAVLLLPSEIRPLRSADSLSGKVINRFRTAGTNGRLDLSLSWRVSEDLLKDHASYGQGPRIHGKPNKVLLLIGKTQLAGCLNVSIGGPLEWDSGIQQLYAWRHSGHCV